MSDTIQARVLHEDKQDETRIVELSTSYEGLSGCYHSIGRKVAIFESEEVVLQWHGGINAPVDLRLTFAEMDALIEQFNSYCEDYNHLVACSETFVPVSAGEVLPDWGQMTPAETCLCPNCTSQTIGYSSSVVRPITSLTLVQVGVPVEEAVTERCSGSCWLCDEPCVKAANHHESCYCSEHR